MKDIYSILVRSHAGLLCLLFICILPVTAFGHAFPVTSEPKVGSTVPIAPPLVRIWFDGALEPAFCTIVVQDTQGKKVDSGDGSVSPSDDTLLQTKVQSLPKGKYRVIWKVVARDGHRTEGDYTFEIK
ncbi:MAG: copper resistance protein CopC [Nitrospirae bacterium]|nr:copper resistance protein CopC [Nitrospirota bacterium]